MSQRARIYSLYGLRVRSTIALPCPEWRGVARTADVDLVEASDEALSLACPAESAHYETDGFWECRQFEDGAARISWKEHFDFFVSGDGTRVLWRRLVGVSNEVLFTYLLNQVLSHCLVARGLEPLHATGIVVGGEALAIMGDSGYGKSTLAAEFLRRGHRLLTDDLLLLDFVGERVLAHPSLARLKISPESADAVFERRRALPMNPFTTKMILPLQASEHVVRAVPLRAIFVIPDALGTAKISIQRARGQRSLLPIIQNSFNPLFLDPKRLAQQFAFASRLARAVPIKLLLYPRQMERLPAVVDSILESLKPGSRPS